MSYKLMRLRKYYDALRTNRPFLKASVKQKIKILINILKFFKSKKSLIINNKPVTAQIEPTSRCNLECEMCIRNKIGIPVGTMSFKNFKKILRKLDCLFKITLSGQGEPFLNPKLFKMIEYSNKRGILVNIYSNGTLLTKNIIDKMCKVEVGEIAISIDSTKKKKYEKIRRMANFDKVINNIKMLTEELRKRKKKTIISIATVLFKDNFEEIMNFVKLAKKIGVKKILFQTLQTKEDYVKSYNSKFRSQISPQYTFKIKKKIEEAKKLAKKYGILIIFDEEKSLGCIWPWRGIYITWNGYVTVCCKILDYRRPFFGDILKENLWKIWNSKQYQMFRKLLRERKAPFPCKGCNMV